MLPRAAGSARGSIADGLGASAEALLFGEGPGGFVISGPREALARGPAVPGSSGRSAATRLDVDGLLSLPLARMRETWEGAIPAALEG